MPFSIVRNDITHMRADAIVNTANPLPVIGSGVDSAIHRAAGPQLLEARQQIGRIDCGHSRITPAFGLAADYVIHTVGPVWIDGTQDEAAILRRCYDSALQLAAEHGCRSIAFPLLATGNYGFPKVLALQIAIQAFSAFLVDHEMKIELVVFSKSAFVLSEKLVSSVQSFIDETYVQENEEIEYGRPFSERYGRQYGVTLHEVRAIQECSPEDGLEAMLKQLDAGFSETLMRLIDRSGRKDSEVYKKANVDRKLFSKIRNHPAYRPSKPTAVAFCMALELDMDETEDLLKRAGYSLSHSSKFDIIVEYFIRNGRYDLFELNETLFQYDQPIVGG